ncbi:hypothetical protein HMPREF2785_01540 [Corynebacterium sp. HMSC067D03]|uniref:hypothetical protein n=1 Tax=Corynebacterium TaxID=1716 RepID=UPI0008A3C851|nr:MULTISPECIES: hypothetical protein [Corynebacterium]MDK8241337.1 hypothetical protein [Corynebacterium coyleae]MDK8799585.1 hypothetical protein [Corynebacterium coyleae]OFL18368.1 hypothetical protein HMPREF2785_01540 [Corynebacterium sp. HMSC067D03]OFL94510.1 hypothetical protein HMPREF2734_04730 [Corynebacterium sp. HMSC055D05]OHO34559.1 hypothetical protein HMPREF2690_03540 [Corynebacterium sp. HMSC034E11]
MTAHLLLPGTAPVIVTAPHAVEQQRDGKIKLAEPATRWLAEQLHEHVGATALIKTDADKADPNSDEHSPFRDVAVREVEQRGIVAGIDLHQMNPDRPDQVILGTGRGRNIHDDWRVRDIVVAEFNACGVPVLVDEIFPAMGLHRVSSDVALRTNIPYVQVEMNSAALDEGPREHMLAALTRIVQRFAEELA